jgi:hypothetical protein
MGALREDKRAIHERLTSRSGRKTSGCPGAGRGGPLELEILIKQRFVTAGCGVTAGANRLLSSPLVDRARKCTRSVPRTKTQNDEDRRAVVPVW